MMLVKKVVLVNKNAIEEELVNSDILIANRIQPYYALNCFKKNEFSLKHCVETCPKEIYTECLRMFKRNGYIKLKEDRAVGNQGCPSQ